MSLTAVQALIDGLSGAQLQAVVSALVAAELGVAASRTCGACQTRSLSSNGVAACGTCGARQAQGVQVIVCGGNAAAQQVCLKEAADLGLIRPDAACYVAGAQVICPVAGAAAEADKSSSKKGLLGLLGLLALIPLCLLLACSCLALLLLRRRKAEPVGYPVPTGVVGTYAAVCPAPSMVCGTTAPGLYSCAGGVPLGGSPYGMA